jgi:nuclear pore complex protein Nup188
LEHRGLNEQRRPYILLSQVLSANNISGFGIDQLGDLLKERSTTIKHCYNPFGGPSPASRKKIESGKVKLGDGYEIVLEGEDKRYILAISDFFGLDECEAAILFRAFLYNQGLPLIKADEASFNDLVEELLEKIQPYYFEERLSVLRIPIPLFRARVNPLDPLHELSVKFLDELFPTRAEKETFLKNVVTQFRRRRDQDITPRVLANPRRAATFARQAIREQLLMLDLVFWIQWDFVSPGTDQVLELWQLGADAALGLSHKYGQLLLDAEAKRLLEDLAAMWILVCLESLNLEPAGRTEESEENQLGSQGLAALNKITSSHQGDWTWAPLATALALLPNNTVVEEAVFHPSPFATLIHLMSTSVFNTAVAWGSDSPLCEPSAIAYRSVLRGKWKLPLFDGIIDAILGFLMRVLTRLTLELLPDPLPTEFQTLWELTFGDGLCTNSAARCPRLTFR